MRATEHARVVAALVTGAVVRFGGVVLGGTAFSWALLAWVWQSLSGQCAVDGWRAVVTACWRPTLSGLVFAVVLPAAFLLVGKWYAMSGVRNLLARKYGGPFFDWLGARLADRLAAQTEQEAASGRSRYESVQPAANRLMTSLAFVPFPIRAVVRLLIPAREAAEAVALSIRQQESLSAPVVASALTEVARTHLTTPVRPPLLSLGILATSALLLAVAIHQFGFPSASVFAQSP